MVHVSRQGQAFHITLWPNRSADWGEAKGWLWLLGVPVAIIATGWALAGAWVIVPFAGLEFGLVAWVMYHVAGRTCRREVVVVEPSRVIVHRGRRYPEKLWVFSRPEAHLRVKHPDREVDALSLTLADDRQTLALGRWLNPADREDMYRALRQAGLGEVSNQWWRAQA